MHIYDQRFDVTGNLQNFCELNKAVTFRILSAKHVRTYSCRHSTTAQVALTLLNRTEEGLQVWCHLGQHADKNKHVGRHAIEPSTSASSAALMSTATMEN